MIISTSDIRVKAKANTHNITAGRVYHLIAAFMENSAGRVTMGTTVLPAHGDYIIERIYENDKLNEIFDFSKTYSANDC